jgi:hypothetical protein
MPETPVNNIRNEESGAPSPYIGGGVVFRTNASVAPIELDEWSECEKQRWAQLTSMSSQLSETIALPAPERPGASPKAV